MRRIPAWVVLAILATGPLWPVHDVQAQQETAGLQETAAELARLWEQLRDTHDPASRITWSERALKLEGEVAAWPLPVSREEAKARLWWWLGRGYAERSGGKAEDLQAAIAAYERAQETVTRDKAPKDWALLQSDLADAYWTLNSPSNDRAEAIEKTIAAREASLTVFNRQDSPLEWADAEINLGLAYQGRIRGERADNLEKAIAGYEAGLTALTREANPSAWGVTHDNLATAYRDRMRGEPAENQEQAIAHYEAALGVRTRAASPAEWAATQTNLGFVLASRIRGDRPQNLAKAIAAYEAALTVRTREASPAEWALTQAYLAAAYALDHGNRADNLEKAIAAYEGALSVGLRDAPKNWAWAQHNLAMAYVDRAYGTGSDNIEKAIALYEAALTVRTRESAPLEWAATQHNLAIAYVKRAEGNRAQNIEKAIALYEAALAVRTREALPQEWAATQHSLGVAYSSRVVGERADNLERSIEHFEQALTVRNRTANANEWADTQLKLGIAFGMRPKGERADNVERAIAASEAALSVLSPEATFGDWARVHTTLAVFYSGRIRGKREENEEQAIVHLDLALQTLRRETLPYEWATTQVALGAAYMARIAGSKAENLDRAAAYFESALSVITRDINRYVWAASKMQLGRVRSQQAGGNAQAAISASEEALGVFTREEFPNEWSVVQGSLGTAYLGSTQGDREAAVAKAAAHLEAALSVQTRESNPQGHLSLTRALGAALSEKGEWRRADAAYAQARETFLLLFAQGLDDAAAGALIGDAGPLFAEAAYAAIRLGETEKALALASEGRAHILAVALKLARDERPRVAELRTAIRIAERAAQATQGLERTAAIDKLVGLRQELLGLVADAAGTKSKAPESALAQARALAGKGGAVVVPILTRLGAKLLVVANAGRPKGSVSAARAKAKANKGPGPGRPLSKDVGAGTPDAADLTAVDVPGLLPKLDRLLSGDDTSRGWAHAYGVNYMADGDERDARWPEWIAAVEGLGPRLWDPLGARIDAALKQAGVAKGAQVVWLPTNVLGIFPIAAALNPASGRYLAEDYEIVYAPSLDALAMVQRQIAQTAPPTLTAVVNPTRDIPAWDLPAAEQEGKLVASYFRTAGRTVLEGPAATPEAVLAALKARSYWHFATHGQFSWVDARQSGLIMHNGEVLSVGRMLESEGLGRPRLVVLSACETGLHAIGSGSNPDEFIGLPGTFTALGAAGVLGTLWPVADTATSFLIAKFYELHLADGLPPPAALRRAQLWLRQATSADLVAYAKAAAKEGRLDRQHVAEVEQELGTAALTRSRRRTLVEGVAPGAGRTPSGSNANRVARPYAHPFYWAGFIYTGL